MQSAYYQPNRNYSRPLRQAPPPVTKKRHLGRYIFACLVLIVGLFFANSSSGHALADSPTVHSGISGSCLDLYHDDATVIDAKVQAWHCNDSDAQSWTVSDTAVKHGSVCLGVEDNAKQAGALVAASPCSSDPGQVWLSDQGGLRNPNSGLCLSAPEGRNGKQLELANCSSLGQPAATWTPYDDGHVASINCDQGSQGERVACYAVKEWTRWQTGNPSHESLLTTYTDGAPYEEWCADFVSYVYKEAGYPFTNGEADGWDESNANDVQYQGFTMHSATNYTPKVGDVAFFDYPGGHVEIVVSGGPHPTFVYGDSATIDPTTGNGQMRANTITSEGSTGQVMYYLSPNS